MCGTEELIEELMKQTSGQIIDLQAFPYLKGSLIRSVIFSLTHFFPEFQVSNSSSELERHVDVRLEELSATTHGNETDR